MHLDTYYNGMNIEFSNTLKNMSLKIDGKEVDSVSAIILKKGENDRLSYIVPETNENINIFIKKKNLIFYEVFVVVNQKVINNKTFLF